MKSEKMISRMLLATASPASGTGPQMPDDRGVGEDVERLRDQRAERRDRQPDDLAVVTMWSEPRAASPHATSWRVKRIVA